MGTERTDEWHGKLLNLWAEYTGGHLGGSEFNDMVCDLIVDNLLHAAPQAGTTAAPHGRATASQDPVRDTEPAAAAPGRDDDKQDEQAMLEARRSWWGAISRRGDPQYLTNAWDAFRDGFTAAISARSAIVPPDLLKRLNRKVDWFDNKPAYADTAKLLREVRDFLVRADSEGKQNG